MTDTIATPLLNAAQLGALIGLSAATVQAKASRAPDDLPPRAPGHLLRWHPKAYEAWAMREKKPKTKVGRPRN
jgi:hypothetical protein